MGCGAGCHIIVLENTLQRLTENATSGVFPLVVVNQRGTAKLLLLHWTASVFYARTDNFNHVVVLYRVVGQRTSQEVFLREGNPTEE